MRELLEGTNEKNLLPMSGVQYLQKEDVIFNLNWWPDLLAHYPAAAQSLSTSVSYWWCKWDVHCLAARECLLLYGGPLANITTTSVCVSPPLLCIQNPKIRALKKQHWQNSTRLSLSVFWSNNRQQLNEMFESSCSHYVSCISCVTLLFFLLHRCNFLRV